MKKQKRRRVCFALIPWRNILIEKMVGTVFKLLVLVAICVLVAYGWLMSNENIETKDLSVHAQALMSVDISMDSGETWSNSIEIDLNENYTFSNEVTGNGIEFYKARKKDENGYPISLIPAQKGKDYYECKILFKASESADIYLDTLSMVYPSAGIEDSTVLMNSNTVIRESPMGNFSRDLIAGAVRIAFIENDYISGEFVEQASPKFVWAPNKGYQIKYENGNYVAVIDSNEAQEYTYLKYVDSENFYEENLENVKDVINASYDSQSSGGDAPITTILNAYEEEKIKAVTIRIWVEGNDREAVYGLKGGLFKVKLSFVGLHKEVEK
jgi:hypothetical protein